MNDLISRQAAIESIDEIVCSMSVCINSDYYKGMRAMKDMALHAIEEQPTVDDNAYKEGYERGRFDALDAISSVYYGKQYYFLEENGTVYSRDSCKYLTLEDAIYEFAEKFGDDGEGY